MPVNAHALSEFFSLETGVWTLVCIAFVAWLKSRPSVMQRRNERWRHEGEAAGEHWDRLHAEIKRLEESRDEWMARAIAAEAEIARRQAVELGMGQARQRAQGALSADRLEDRERRDRKGKSDREGGAS